MAQLIPMFKKELEEEAAITREMLSRIPEDQFNWKPHEKSMSMIRLATHIAELPEWIVLSMTADGLDFATQKYKPRSMESKRELLKFFENRNEMGDSYLRPEFEEKLQDVWILQNGETVIREYTRDGVIRMVLNQITHHRAQLGVYLRLLNVPIPGSYGPSADEH